MAQEDLKAEQQSEKLAYEREQRRWKLEAQMRDQDRQRRLQQQQADYTYGRPNDRYERPVERGYDRAGQGHDRDYVREYDRVSNQYYGGTGRYDAGYESAGRVQDRFPQNQAPATQRGNRGTRYAAEEGLL